MTNADPGHEEELFKPQIHTRTKIGKRSDGKSAHERLYDHANDQNVRKHNEQVALLENFTKGMPLKATEMAKRNRTGSSATWVADRKMSKTGKVRTVRVNESASQRVSESASRRVSESASQRVSECRCRRQPPPHTCLRFTRTSTHR